MLTPGFFVALAMLTVFAIMLWQRVPALIAAARDKKMCRHPRTARYAAKLRAEAAALKAEYEAKAKAAESRLPN